MREFLRRIINEEDVLPRSKPVRALIYAGIFILFLLYVACLERAGIVPN